MTTELMHLSESVLERLREDVATNLSRYRAEGFYDLAREPGWSIALKVPVDLDALSELDGSERTAAADLRNSRIVWTALSRLTPSLANEEQIWVRLSHIEGFKYAQARWLNTAADDQILSRDINNHFFAAGQTRIRDDHALSRLWWNRYVAGHCFPEDPDFALTLLLSRADIRSNLVERIWLTSRKKLAGGLFRLMSSTPWVLSSDSNFRTLMKLLNLRGGGVVFEIMTDAEIDTFLRNCAEEAQLVVGLSEEANRPTSASI